MDETIVLFYRLKGVLHMKKLLALILILGLFTGCAAPDPIAPAEETTAVTEPASDPLEGPEGLPAPAL